MELSTQNAFQVIFPKYVELLTQSPLYADEGLQTFIRDQLPQKIELVRSIEPTFLSFQTQFTNLILKRPKQQNLLQSLVLKASQKIQKLFYNLELSTDKQINKGSLNNQLAFMNLQQTRTRFRQQMKDVGPLLKQKYFDSIQLEKNVEEQIARRLYLLNEIYYFLKNDLSSVASRFRIKEHEVLNEINKNGSSGNSNLQISQLIYLDEKLIENIKEVVDKRYRPFLGKKDFFYSKVKQIQNQSESKVPMNITALVQSILGKEKYRLNKQITANLTRQFKTMDESIEQEVEKDCKEIITDVDSLKRQFNQLKNNVFYLDIIRGSFTQKYKMELNKLENVYYLSNIQKYLQDVQTFTEKLIRVEEKIIQNRKGFMKRLGKQIEEKIAGVTTEYELKNSSSSQTLQDLIDKEFNLLKDNLYGMVSDDQPNRQTFNSSAAQDIRRQKANQFQRRRLEVQRTREEKQGQRRRELEEKAEKQRIKRQEDRIKLQQKRRTEDERIRRMKQERQEAERIRKMQQMQKQHIRNIQMQEKRKLMKIKEEEQRQRTREEMKRKQEEKKKKQAEDSKTREKLRAQKQLEEKRKLEEMDGKRREVEEMKRKKEEQQRQQEHRLKQEKQRIQRQKKQQEQRDQRQREQRNQQEKQERQRRQRQLKSQRQRQQQQRKQQQQKQKKQRQAKLEKDKKQKQLKEQQDRQKKQKQRMAMMQKEERQAEQRQNQKRSLLQKQKRQKEEKQRRDKEEREKRDRQERQRKQKQQRQAREKRENEEQQRRERQQREQRQRKERQLKQKKQKEDKQRKQQEERQKKQRQQMLKRQKEDQQRKERLEKQKKQRQEKERLQKQKKQKQEADRLAKLKRQEQERQRKQMQQKQKKELELLMEQEENTKKNKSKVSNDRKSKGGSGINYDDLDQLMDDDLEQIQQKESKVSKSKVNQGDDEEEYGDDYEDDFESPQKDEQGSGALIEPKELITLESIKSLNDYMKGTSYSRKNKPNLEPFNNKQSYAYLFQEFTASKKLFIFDSAVSKAILDFSKQLMDENANEDDLKMSIETIKEEMFNDYASKTEEENFDPRTTLILPFAFENEFDIKIIEFLPGHGWFRPVIGKQIAEEEAQAKFNSILEGLLHIFEIQTDPQIQTLVIPEQSKMVLQTFDKDLPCLLTLFALHYEVELKQDMEITQYTVQRFFYTIQVLKPLYEAIENNQDELVGFYEKVHQKYSENEPIRILPLEIQSSDPEYQGKLQQYSLQAKQMFVDDKTINTLLILFQVLIAPEEEDEDSEGSFQKISIYCSIERTAPKPTITYFIVTKDDFDKENASTLFDIISEGDDEFEVNVLMDFTRHNGLSNYSDWALPLWARSIQKRKLTPTNAFRAITFAMSPYYIAYKEQD